ncbi:MAG: UDP-N-acetylmuramate dehydrogenase [Propionivibrio sp.]|uniref:UDP-N-acetylmuramate dehydrogenase n=1 Tax=Propionivibrio sp. TaxID=2212460 RepID=UPI001A466EF7|nr:UDP-N-acetylmuramate dehydrogenase [Propionivibrio sp.]MBL8414530.1 UDP-N-acetylmuramate dehydrogenase [Propionivibrio sp.]
MHTYLTNIDLLPLNTLALPGRAARYLRVTEAKQLADSALCERHRFVLGSGSNLVLSGDFDGLILHMAITGRELAGEDADAWYVRAGAGENWNEFVDWTLTQGWPGLENLSLIPGTVGAAPIQNIGAYGLEIAERFHSLAACDMNTGRIVRLDRSACRFGYRDSVFKQEGWYLDGRYAITEVTFRLPKVWQSLTRYADVAAELEAQGILTANARQIAAAVIAVRQRKLPDPQQIPNVGSFFHNPVVDSATADRLQSAHPGLPLYPQNESRVKLAAGWLIEQAGWKGKNLGPVGMYEKQALVLVNRGGATGADVATLMQAIQRDVRMKFGVELTPEPIFL